MQPKQLEHTAWPRPKPQCGGLVADLQGDAAVNRGPGHGLGRGPENAGDGEAAAAQMTRETELDGRQRRSTAYQTFLICASTSFSSFASSFSGASLPSPAGDSRPRQPVRT